MPTGVSRSETAPPRPPLCPSTPPPSALRPPFSSLSSFSSPSYQFFFSPKLFPTYFLLARLLIGAFETPSQMFPPFRHGTLHVCVCSEPPCAPTQQSAPSHMRFPCRFQTFDLEGKRLRRLSAHTESGTATVTCPASHRAVRVAGPACRQWGMTETVCGSTCAIVLS